MPIVACENFIFTGIIGTLIGVAASTAEEDRTYLAMTAEKESTALKEAFTLSTQMLKAHQKMGYEEKPTEQL
jgi:hypothetical protein